MAKLRSLLKALANTFSMITVPSSVLVLPHDPYNKAAWILLAAGVVIQIAKYYFEYLSEEVAE